MNTERYRLLAAALLWVAAGAAAAVAVHTPSTRAGVAAVLLMVVGGVAAAPLWRRGPPAVVSENLTQEPLRQAELQAQDSHRLTLLQAQLEHLPVAAWVQRGAELQALSSRARRLAAPGGVRDKTALHSLLCAATRPGPLLLDTERGQERWQLQRQPLALDGQAQTLLVLVPLESELETESLQAWQQLVQVLTHEIMNSLTPIKSLSQTALVLLDEPQGGADLRTALDAIAHRADGLSSFVQTYRRVSQWPAPSLAPVSLQAFFARLQQVVVPAWAARGGQASFELASPTLQLQADEGQLEQLLLALLHNAEQATAEQAAPRLWVQARQGRGGRLQISVRDNGPGVPPGLERKIFLPFFSAREGGQGIGLTVVRQLVHGMHGRVRHVRPLEGGAAFVLSF
jgi:signal transduction histidine kinase